MSAFDLKHPQSFTMGSLSPSNSSLKPVFHITASHGWMNDPCGPGYDSTTGTYHLFYQWNPKSCEWGNISWGHVTSNDMLKWRNSSKNCPVLSPDRSYDKDGVFTGCLLPQGWRGEADHLTLVYSSVNHLPLHWSIPYHRGCEGVSIATSRDGGRSWEKLPENPVVAKEPDCFDVTGFRDPYVAAWPALDKTMGEASATGLYGVVSGGVRDQGPAVFLYKLDRKDLTKWEYAGLLFTSTLNFRRSRKWSGDFGVNWECAGFMTLASENKETTREVLIMGSEGGNERLWVKSYLATKPATLPKRTTRYCLWSSGELSKCAAQEGGRGTEVSMTNKMDGMIDHGCFYAANTFFDPIHNRRVLWGWLPEEDLPMEYCTAKGWNGSLALPRELFIQRLEGVSCALSSRLEDIGSIRIEESMEPKTFTIETLGIRPLPELSQLRSGQVYILSDITLPTEKESKHQAPVMGATWEIEATIAIDRGCDGVGFMIRHDPEYINSTTIEFLPELEEIIVVREASNSALNINKSDERGPFTLFKTKKSGKDQVEALQLRIFSDNDILEVYANERFALSTMIYVDNPEAVCTSLFARGSAGSAIFQDVKFWSGMNSIFDD